MYDTEDTTTEKEGKNNKVGLQRGITTVTVLS
jgi:hypothetical protein